MAKVLHRGGFPPISPEAIGKAMRDGRAYAHRAKPLHVRIDPPVRWLEWTFVCLVFGAICFAAAVM